MSKLPIYHKCDAMEDVWDVFYGPSDIYPDDWQPGDWTLEMNEYSTVVKYCPYCGVKLEIPEGESIGS